MTTVGVPDETRPLRADAARNLDRILAAARAVFAELGPEAQIDDVARRAGVGVGTVYRRFATKELLLRAVIDRRMIELDEVAARAVHADDPLDGIAALVRALVESALQDRLLVATMMEQPPPSGPGPSQKLATVLDRLVERGRNAGLIRADITAAHLQPLITGLIIGVVHLGDTPWERSLQIVVDGLTRTATDGRPAETVASVHEPPMRATPAKPG